MSAESETTITRLHELIKTVESLSLKVASIEAIVKELSGGMYAVREDVKKLLQDNSTLHGQLETLRDDICELSDKHELSADMHNEFKLALQAAQHASATIIDQQKKNVENIRNINSSREVIRRLVATQGAKLDMHATEVCRLKDEMNTVSADVKEFMANMRAIRRMIVGVTAFATFIVTLQSLGILDILMTYLKMPKPGVTP